MSANAIFNMRYLSVSWFVYLLLTLCHHPPVCPPLLPHFILDGPPRFLVRACYSLFWGKLIVIFSGCANDNSVGHWDAGGWPGILLRSIVSSSYVGVSVCAWLYVCACVCVCAYVCGCVYAYVCECTWVSVCAWVQCVYAFSVCVCLPVHIFYALVCMCMGVSVNVLCVHMLHDVCVWVQVSQCVWCCV